FATNGSMFASDGAAISIHSSKAGVSGGGFLALGQLVSFTNRSSLVMQDVRAKQYGGGFLAAFGSVIFGGMSEMTVVDGHASTLDGGGFVSARQLRVDGGSTIRLRNVSAGRVGGGFAIRKSRARVRGHSRVMISDSHADESGGGLYVAILEVSDNAAVSIQNSSAEVAGGGLYVCGCNLTWLSLGAELVVVSKSSFLSIQGTKAQFDGGGLYANGAIVVAGASNVVVSDSHSVRGQGGGLIAKRKVQVVDGSMLRFRHVSAGDLGGAFGIVVADAESVLVANESGLSIDGATAGTNAGGFYIGSASSNAVVTGYSKLVLSDSHAQKGSGGGFITSRLQVTDHATVLIHNCWASGTGVFGGGFQAVHPYHEILETVLVANSSVLSMRASKATAGGGFLSAGKVLVTDASKLEASECHAREGGGFSASALQVTGRSSVSIENATATSDYGGFRSEKGVVVSDGSTISLRGTMAGRNAGGFGVFGPLVLAGRSQISVRNSFARTGCCGGFFANQRLPDRLPAVQVTGGSAIHIDNAKARLNAGGFLAEGGAVKVGDGSQIRIQNSATAANGGGFTVANNGLSVVNGSAIRIRTATAGQNAGGFGARNLQVTSRSMIHIKRAQASLNGGGFFVQDQALVTGHSEVVVSNSRAIEGHGGGLSASRLYLTQNSTVDVRTTSAGQQGGGVSACGCFPNSASDVVLVADGSSLSVWNATAASDGGGLSAGGQVVITGWSTVAASYCHATSRNGGGVAAVTLLLNDSSVVSIQKTTAGQFGGGLYTEGSTVVGAASTLTISNSSAELHGGGVYAASQPLAPSGAFPGNLVLDGGMLIISDSRVKGLGAAAFVQNRLLVGSGSGLNVHHAVGGDLSSVVAAGCMQLSPGATVLLEDVVGGHGLDLRNADCSSACANRTFEVASGASLTASGHLRSGLLALQTCPVEVVHLSHMHLLSWSSPVLSSYTRPHQVVVTDVSIGYKPPLHDALILAARDEFTVDSLDVSCKDCGHGVAFNASRSELRALSTPSLVCPMAASVTKGMLQRCACANHQTTRRAYADREVVMLQDMMHTCTFCKPHTSFINGTCRKCAPYNAWSDGKSDSCHFLPRDSTQFGALFAASASCVFLAFVFYQILHAPLVIVDAKSQRIPHPLRKAGRPFPDWMEQRSFAMSLQGPIVDLPQLLSRQLYRQLCYRVKGTGLQWLDFSPQNAKAVRIFSIESSKVEVQDVHVPYDCAAAIGALHAAELTRLMLALCAALFLAVLLPVAVQVAFMSGNGMMHVLVTAGYCALPVCLAALILHPGVAWLIDQRCHRTPFAKLLDEYRRRIHFDPHPGPDATHPSKQGLMVLTLWELWGHFEPFILDRNMHFVVNNMVRPLTRDKQVSFVSLWGGRQVDYFVSHSWGTSFAHFVRSIHCHALSREGQRWMDVSYWICSFANNQWDIEAELGETIMDSAFARTLRGDIKGVAMVLDHEVQPLTRACASKGKVCWALRALPIPEIRKM
ncbi:pmpB, partial [Symbiodinium necroappetens]